MKGLNLETAKKVALKVGLTKQADKTADMLMKMYELFLKKDALLIEINPYAEDADEQCNNNNNAYNCFYLKIIIYYFSLLT